MANYRIGLDIAEWTGWAVIDDRNCLVDYGAIHCDVKKYDWYAFKKYIRALRSVLNKYRPEYICIEDIYYRNNIKTFKGLAIKHGAIISAAINLLGNKTSIRYLQPTAVRSSLNIQTGSSRTQAKEAVCAWVNSKYNLNLRYEPYNENNHDDDMADAIAVVCAITLKEGATNGDAVRELKSCPRKKISHKKSKRSVYRNSRRSVT